MLKDNSSALTGNDQYEGFSVDLLDALAEILKFKYEITTAPKNYGKIANNYTEAWDGVVGMILNKVNFLFALTEIRKYKTKIFL